MPDHIVRDFRHIYWKKFMRQTLRALPGSAIRTEAFVRMNERTLEEKEGFPDCEILISFETNEHPKVWGSNLVLEDANGKRTGVICVARPLVENVSAEGREILKAVLAEEWIEVMQKLRDGADQEKMVREKEELVVLFSLLKRPALWQDSPEREQKLHYALRHLLVPQQVLAKMLKRDFELTFEQLIVKTKENSTSVSVQVLQMARKFSADWSVELDLVFDRIREILYAPKAS